ncbi:MAG: flagellar biosynthesis anti-sigma factor FlgM [Bdellovibrionales bacterium]|nr:flagellar biosynthesis anti-sigma factor FlgM [Bdellovibrionales bacterium]
MSKEAATNENNKRAFKNLTSLSLNWLADKLRKKERLQEKIANGEYSVDSQKIAESMVEAE